MILKVTVQKQSFNKHFLTSVLKSNCPEVFCGTLDSYLQLNEWLSISFPMRSLIKLVIMNITYTRTETYPLS